MVVVVVTFVLPSKAEIIRVCSSSLLNTQHSLTQFTMTDATAVGRMVQGEKQQQQQQQQQQSESPPPQSNVVNDNDAKQEEGATGFGANFRKSWQNLRRRQSAISSSASSISGVEQQDNRDDGEEGNKNNGIVDLLNEVDDTNGKSILLRRADQISISYEHLKKKAMIPHHHQSMPILFYQD